MLCLKKAARYRQSFQRSLQLRSVIRWISGFMGFHSSLVDKLCQWLLSCMFTEISPCVMDFFLLRHFWNTSSSLVVFLFQFKEIANVTLTEENSLKVVEELKTLTSQETLNGEDTKVTLEILEKVATSDNLLTKNKQNRKEMGQVSLG